MRCSHNTYPAGQPDNHRAAVRCEATATYWLIHPDSTRNPGGQVCEAHGVQVITEYRAKLGEAWTLQPIDEYGVSVGQTLCPHPIQRQRAWFARDDTAILGQVLCIACCDCGAVLAGGVITTSETAL